MKTMNFPYASTRAGRSLTTALCVAGLQLLLMAFPMGSLRAWGANNDGNAFNWTNLQSDIPGVADRTDPNLVNSWGLAINPNADPRTGPFWVADNGTGVSTVYEPDGTPFPVGKPLVVTIPPTPAQSSSPSAPTGIVFNSVPSSLFPNAFQLSNGQRASFIFDGEDGRITAWNGGDGATAEVKFDNSASGAVYKGLALAVRSNGGPTLYATNFHSGHVDVFDNQFQPVTIPDSFVDNTAKPDLPMGAVGWAPFNIAAINGKIYVTFAAQNAEKHDDVAGPGAGFVDVFSTDGVFMGRLITGGNLNSPWGLAKVPDGTRFGKFYGNALFVGNFGDGFINAYDISSGASLGQLQHRVNQPLQFNGLWALVFFNHHLYFTAGIADEAHGLFGVIRPAGTHIEKETD